MKTGFVGVFLHCAAVALVTHSPAALAAGLCPSTKSNLEWSGRCFEKTDTGRRVRPEYVKSIAANKSGYATIVIDEPRELVAVDRRGVVAISNIYHTGDFDYPTANGNIGRYGVRLVNEQGQSLFKCGYFHTTRFQIVIPAVYDNCHPFHDDEAVVCKDCARYCTEPDCQNSVFIGGQGFALDRRNRIVRELAPLTLDKACASPELVQVKESSGATGYLQCLPKGQANHAR